MQVCNDEKKTEKKTEKKAILRVEICHNITQSSNEVPPQLFTSLHSTHAYCIIVKYFTTIIFPAADAYEFAFFQ